MLAFFSILFHVLGYSSDFIKQVAAIFPSSLHGLYKLVGYRHDSFIKYVVCPNPKINAQQLIGTRIVWMLLALKEPAGSVVALPQIEKENVAEFSSELLSWLVQKGFCTLTGCSVISLYYKVFRKSYNDQTF